MVAGQASKTTCGHL